MKKPRSSRALEVLDRPAAPKRTGSHATDTAETQDEIANHPFASAAGSMKDNPYWEEMMEGIQRYRRELDAEVDASEE